MGRCTTFFILFTIISWEVRPQFMMDTSTISQYTEYSNYTVTSRTSNLDKETTKSPKRLVTTEYNLLDSHIVTWPTTTSNSNNGIGYNFTNESTTLSSEQICNRTGIDLSDPKWIGTSPCWWPYYEFTNLTECILKQYKGFQVFTLWCCEPFFSIPGYIKPAIKESVNERAARWSSRSIHVLITDVFISIPLCLMGLIGNILSIVVLRKDRQTTSVLLLEIIAVVDGLYCLWYLLFDPYIAIHSDTNWLPDLSIENEKVHWIPLHKMELGLVNKILLTLSHWLIVLVTFDRFIAVNFPLQARVYNTIKAVIVEVSVAVALAIALNVPGYWILELSLVQHECLFVRPFIKTVTSDLGNSYPFMVGYATIFEGLVRVVIPVVIVIALNVVLVLTLRKASKKRQELTQGSHKNGSRSTQTKETHINVMLISVATLYLICLLPSVAARILLAYTVIRNPDDDKQLVDGADIFGYYVALMTRINSAVNFLIYIFASKRFRKDVCSIITCRRRDVKEHGSTLNASTALSNTTRF